MWRLLAGLTMLATACSGSGRPALVVGVASSMTEAARELGDAYAAGEVELSVAGSQVLVTQVREGAPLDVIITADAATATDLVGLGVVSGEPVVFAHNRLAIAVAEGNPLGITGLANLAEKGLVVVLAAPEVPAGRYTESLLARAGVSISVSSLEPSVRSVLAKVRLGEADAGIVYRTDLAVGGVGGVEIPGDINPPTDYYAIALTTAGEADAAASFVAFLQTAEAAAILDRLGFRS